MLVSFHTYGDELQNVEDKQLFVYDTMGGPSLDTAFPSFLGLLCYNNKLVCVMHHEYPIVALSVHFGGPSLRLRNLCVMIILMTRCSMQC